MHILQSEYIHNKKVDVRVQQKNKPKIITQVTKQLRWSITNQIREQPLNFKGELWFFLSMSEHFLKSFLMISINLYFFQN